MATEAPPPTSFAATLTQWPPSTSGYIGIVLAVVVVLLVVGGVVGVLKRRSSVSAI